jgi:hypothetical protein
MNTRPQQRDGKILMLDIAPPISILQGVDLDRIVLADGEHFFTKEGYYDGWGKSTSQTRESQVKQQPHGEKES